ncbi:hypothetical protein OG453_25340 [Streptomyces sp. NBC_01381]|uniref:hypothetical protein n=1 Tax=Streptomyces sp. NBC_01381 TaxID=2903845 RepID=UPI002256BC34|nr:hypothetical protein [Streptomyces sp. NBC_01381]MCX4669973.1 hypothetical protein [Streptomyces sp. NBC_01381]
MNKRLAAAIERENELEERGMHGDDRKTCWTHQEWAEDCADAPMHTHPSTNNYPRPA